MFFVFFGPLWLFQHFDCSPFGFDFRLFDLITLCIQSPTLRENLVLLTLATLLPSCRLERTPTPTVFSKDFVQGYPDPVISQRPRQFPAHNRWSGENCCERCDVSQISFGGTVPTLGAIRGRRGAGGRQLTDDEDGMPSRRPSERQIQNTENLGLV